MLRLTNQARAALYVFLVLQAAMLFTATRSVHAQPRVAVRHTMSSALDVFRTGNQQKFTLSRVPSPDGSVLVFVNGLLMLEGEDYNITVTALTFTKQAIGDGPIIQVQYWTAN